MFFLFILGDEHPGKLLDRCTRRACKDGVPDLKVADWLRRKDMGHMTVLRWKADGTLGCSVPCILCRRELLRYDIRFRCVLPDGSWYDGPMDAPDAPVCKMTSMQKNKNKNMNRRRVD